MNSTPRTATRGGSKSKSDSNTGKGHKSDSKRDGQKNTDSSKSQGSSVSHANPVTDELSLKSKIAQIMTIISKTEDEVMTALYDSDLDLNKAVSMLLEGNLQGEWETSGKKKKNKQASATKVGETSGNRNQSEQDAEEIDAQPLSSNQDRERSRGRGGGAHRPRGRGSSSRGSGRGRGNNKENEGSSGDDGFRGGRMSDGYRRGGRGMSNGPGSRGGRGGRGGGRLGSRTFQGRDGRDKPDGDRFPSTIDTWDPVGSQDGNDKPLKMDTWRDSFPAAEDWDNEEYTGSLADSKVFTPSALETSVVAPEPIQDTSNQDLLSMATSTGQDFHHSGALNSSPQPVGVGALNTAQAQYFTQLTQQAAENLKASAANSVYGQTESLKSAVGISNNSTFVPSGGYGQSTTYGQSNYAPTTYSAQTTAYPSTAAGNAYSTTTPASAYASTNQGYQNTNNSSFSVYPSSGSTYANQSYTSSSPSPYDNTSTTADGSTASQPPRSKAQRPRVPPPSKIPSTAVEMPEDPISASVSSLDVQFGCLEFGSDSATFEASSEQGTKLQAPSSVAVPDVSSSSASAVGLDTTTSQQTTLNAYSSAKNVPSAASASQQSTLVAGLSAKGLTSNDGLNIQSTGDLKSSYSTQQTRPVNANTGLDSTKCDVGNLSYSSTPAVSNYTAYQSQKSNSNSSTSNVYQQSSYSTSAYTTPQNTYSNAVPSSYSTTAYSNQSSVNSSFPNSSYSSQQQNYATSGASYPTANSFQNTSQNYQSSSVYAAALSSGYSPASGYQNSYSTGSGSSVGKLTTGLTSAKDTPEYSAPTTSNISSTTSTTSSLLTSPSNPQTATTASSKITTGAMKSSVVPNLHPPMLGTPQYIVGGTSMPFYHQTPMYGFEDVQLIHSQRIPHVAASGYYDMGYSAPTSLATGRDALANVAYTVADTRYSGRGDNNASPVPSTLSQQTANAAHQQPILNSFPPGYTYVYNAVPGSFQYSAPLYPVPSAGNAHGSSSSQYAKPASYGSTYGTGYDGLNQAAADYSKSPYVSGAVKAGVGASVSSANTASDLYGKAHTALGKVNSYDKQGFHSATPPPFNIATGQGASMAASGPYPQIFIPTMPPHQHHSQALITSHLQDSANSSAQRSQSAAQPSKSANKQGYNPYWTSN